MWYLCVHRRISQGVRGGGRPPWSLRKQSFRAVSGQIKCIFKAKLPSGLLEIHLDNLKATRPGSLKQLPGPSLQVSRSHFQGKFTPAPLPRRRPVRLCLLIGHLRNSLLLLCNHFKISYKEHTVTTTHGHRNRGVHRGLGPPMLGKGGPGPHHKGPKFQTNFDIRLYISKIM